MFAAADACDVIEDVEAAEETRSLREERVDWGRIGSVASHEMCDAQRLQLHETSSALFRRPAGNDNGRPFIQETSCGSETQTGGAADDQAAFALESVHVPCRPYNGATRLAYWA